MCRDSESRRNDFSLSVRDGDTVKHYRIRQLDEGGFFIARRTTFRTLQELVEHYTRDADGLCVNLRKACVQVWSQRCWGFEEFTEDVEGKGGGGQNYFEYLYISVPHRIP